MSAGCWFGSCGGHFDTVDKVSDRWTVVVIGGRGWMVSDVTNQKDDIQDCYTWQLADVGLVLENGVAFIPFVVLRKSEEVGAKRIDNQSLSCVVR